MTFPTAATPGISNSEVFPPAIANAFKVFAAQVIADLLTLAGVTPETSPAPFTARCCPLSLHAYNGTGTGTLTSTATGTFASQTSTDNVTLAVGDQIFLQPGLTNLQAIDSGPWLVSALGATGTAKWVLKRPSWWATGAKWTSGQIVKVGGEGQIYNNTEWMATAASGVIDTTDPAFYVGRITFQVVLGTTTTATEALAAAQPSAYAEYPLGTSNGSGNHSFPVGILSASQSNLVCTLNTPHVATLTVGYGPSGALTAGYVGTAAATVIAYAVGMAASGDADVSVINCTLTNW